MFHLFNTLYYCFLYHQVCLVLHLNLQFFYTVFIISQTSLSVHFATFISCMFTCLKVQVFLHTNLIILFILKDLAHCFPSTHTTQVHYFFFPICRRSYERKIVALDFFSRVTSYTKDLSNMTCIYRAINSCLIEYFFGRFITSRQSSLLSQYFLPLHS